MAKLLNASLAHGKELHKALPNNPAPLPHVLAAQFVSLTPSCAASIPAGRQLGGRNHSGEANDHLMCKLKPCDHRQVRTSLESAPGGTERGRRKVLSCCPGSAQFAEGIVQYG